MNNARFAMIMFSVLGLALPQSSIAQCASSSRSSNQLVSYDRVQLKPVGFTSTQLTSFRNGYESWNDIQCNVGGEAFPYFQEIANNALRIVTLQLKPGLGPNPTSCARTVGNVVELYQNAQNPNGSTYDCLRADILQDNVAHELGHLLGLGDQTSSSCGSYAMGPVAFTASGAYVDRGVRPSECLLVNDVNNTPAEQQRVQCEQDPSLCEDPCLEPGSCPSPIVIDWQGDGLELTNLERGVTFDLDADGSAENTAWTRPGRNEAFLVFDRNGNGVIDDGAELFGTSTPTISGFVPNHGYNVLFEYEVEFGNANEWVEPGDPLYHLLLLWFDRNHNGRSEPTELIPLARAGLVAVATTPRLTLERDGHGNRLFYRAPALRRGHRGELLEIETVDVFFATSPDE